MGIPNREECFRLLRRLGVPAHIMEHSRKVHRVALFLSQALNQRGEKLDLPLVEAASLLHDIAKMDGDQASQGHAEKGAALIQQLGYPQVAEIVRQHVVLDPAMGGREINEAAVVHYADKRVKHTQIVSLRERFRDLKERYGQSPEAVAWLENAEKQSLALEKILFEKLPFSPDRINSLEEERT
jgi:uncharacterized protein